MAQKLPNHMRCVGTSTTTRERCRKARTPGTTVCRNHGSAAPQVRAAAERRVTAAAVQADAAAILASEGVGIVGDPFDALEHLAAEVLAVKQAAAARVNALGEQIRYRSGQGAEQLRSEVALYERSLDRATKILETLAKLGLDERRVEVQERLAEQVTAVLRAVLDDLDLSPTQQAAAPVIVGRHLVALRAGAA